MHTGKARHVTVFRMHFNRVQVHRTQQQVIIRT